MSVFNECAQYYDLIYSRKDYAGESEYIHKIIQAHCPDARTVLNLGCGSGRHDQFLAMKGYSIVGVDFSKDMLLSAERNAGRDYVQNIQYMHGDIRNIRLGKTFDVVISLFHVMSYQVTNEDLINVFTNAKRHLESGGVFIFDYWYGPAVLSDRPVVRVLDVEDESCRIIRIAQPKMVANRNLVEVGYTFHVHDKKHGSTHDINERHIMRYLFIPELEMIGDSNKLSIVKSHGWLSDDEPGFITWYACSVCLSI
jgi:SAM-dependent methyltransferase